MQNRFLFNCERKNLINDCENGAKPIELMFKYKISERTIGNTINNKKNILKACENGLHKRSRIEQNSHLINHDDKVRQFIVKCQDAGIPLTATIIKERARILAIEMGRDSLQCSWKWWSRFKERIQLKSGKLSGEKKSVNMNLVNHWKEQEIPRILINWQKQFIYNCDETGLFWRQVPVKTYFISKTHHIGDKLFNERISILFCVNLAGEKLPPLVINNAMKPRCFSSGCLDDLNLMYTKQANSWMDSQIFQHWLKLWNESLVEQNKKVLLLLDNFKGHNANYLEYSNITFKFLPANTTCLTQPLDGGIIKSFKSKYLSLFVNHLIDNLNSNHVSDLSKKITILDALNWVDESWTSVTSETIINCWAHFGYGNVTNQKIDEENDLRKKLHDLSNLNLNVCKYDDYIEQNNFEYINYFDD